MNSSESSVVAAAAELVGHPHEVVHVLLVHAPRATRSSCHRLSAFVITGGKVVSSILVTVFDSACSRSGTSNWFIIIFMDICDIFDICVIFSPVCMFSRFWKNSGLNFTDFNYYSL